ncbi:FadR/GntR family transcriptional regulator [Frankia tisae]|uniref:FadR/GntR family transcriptional regulator n=1 Tax=Frankia tisae TaxID=2950104 RepID=UPI0021BDFA46|nr:FCD domain-containing protein [Frankia tisae]
MSVAEPVGAAHEERPEADRRVRQPKSAELVASHLRRQIVRGELAAGEALPSESALMAQFHVSRPTLREAFRVLESESLILVRMGPGGGARVRPPNVDVAARYAGLILQHQGTGLADVLQVREVIEPQAVAHLARAGGPGEIARLRAVLDEPADPAASPLETLRRLERFHPLLIELTGNQTLQVLMRMIEHIVELADRSRVQSDAGSPDLATAVARSRAAHARVVDLIEARDAERAERLWRRHLVAGRDYLERGDGTTVLDVFG